MTQKAAKTGPGPTAIVAIEQHFPEGVRIGNDDLAYRILPFAKGAPANHVATFNSGDGIALSWDAVTPAPGFDPDGGFGFYQIGLRWRTCYKGQHSNLLQTRKGH